MRASGNGGEAMAKTSTERTRKWRAEHPEEARQTAAERMRKWREAHPEEAKRKNLEAVHRYREKKKAEKAASQNVQEESTARLSDKAMDDIYQSLTKQGLV